MDDDDTVNQYLWNRFHSSCMIV